MAHTFDNLYYLVRVQNTNGFWNNIPGETPATTNIFRIASISNTSYYGTAPQQFINIVDWSLDISSIDNSFSGLPTQNPLAKIPKTSFSIDNLELIYHRLSEANGGDLNVFYGAQIDIFLCNGLVPGLFWDSAAELWENDFGIKDPNWQIGNPGADYPSNDFYYKIFTGTIDDVKFSVERTSFSVLGANEKLNRKFGTLAGFNSDFKTRGDIIPITFGDWSNLGDLAPLILERDSSDVPRIFLDTQPIQDVFNLRLYDKVSELDYKVENQKSISSDNTTISFQDDEAAADLERTITNSVRDWRNGSELQVEVNSSFPGDKQKLYNIDGELVAFHDKQYPPFPPNSIYTSSKQASRGWNGSELAPHNPTDQLFELDTEIQKANALITIDLQLNELYNILTTGGDTSLIRTTGSLWETLQNTDPNLQDPNGDNYFWRYGVTIDQLGPSNFQIIFADYQIKFKDFGFTGDVLSYNIEASVMGEVYTSAPYQASRLNKFEILNNDKTTAFLTIEVNTDISETPYDFENASSEISANYPTTDDLKEGLRLAITVMSDSATDDPDIPSNIKWNYFNANCRLRVYAENGLWYWRGVGRTNGVSAIEQPSDIIENILDTELGFTDFIDNTQSRSDWKCATSIYGKEPNYRSWIKSFLQNNGMASFQNLEGEEVVFDLEKKVTPDYTLNANQVELKNNLQAITYSFSGREDLYNEFVIKFRKNPANDQFLNILKVNENEITSTDPLAFFTTGDSPGLRSLCADASKSLGLTNEFKQFVFEADAIRDQRTAEQLLQHFVRWHTSTKSIVKVNTILSETYQYELGEQLVFGNVDGLPNKVKNAQYIITGKRLNPNFTGQGPSLEYTLVEVI